MFVLISTNLKTKKMKTAPLWIPRARWRDKVKENALLTVGIIVDTNTTECLCKDRKLVEDLDDQHWWKHQWMTMNSGFKAK